MTTDSFIVAIDGPAASGKGTLARRIAQFYNFFYLDTGLTYRAVACQLLEKHLPLDDESIAAEIALNIDLSTLSPQILSAHHIGEAASKVAVMKTVRHNLVHAQRQFCQEKQSVVMDGRDIGTVVCPHAQVKLFVTADVTVRAQRRADEIAAKGGDADYNEILADLERRDARDMTRAESPLKPAEDALLLDTSEMGIEAAFNAACRLIDPVWEDYRQHHNKL